MVTNSRLVSPAGFTSAMTPGRLTRSQENLERVAFEFAEDNYAEGVRYFEVRFAPQLHARGGESDLDICNVLRSVDRGLRRATEEANANIKSADEPE